MTDPHSPQPGIWERSEHLLIHSVAAYNGNVLCACLGLLREVSLTQAAVEAFYNSTTTAIYHALFSVDPRAAGGRGVLSSSEYVMCECIVLPAVHAILLCSKGCWWR
jgi:hypothetical protein